MQSRAVHLLSLRCGTRKISVRLYTVIRTWYSSATFRSVAPHDTRGRGVAETMSVMTQPRPSLLGVLVIGALLCVTLADRKSTRLNSSHQKISYAVFCLKKKK